MTATVNLSSMFTVLVVCILIGIGLAAVLYAKDIKKPVHYFPIAIFFIAVEACLLVLIFIHDSSPFSKITMWGLLALNGIIAPVLVYFEATESPLVKAEPSTNIVTTDVQKLKELTADEKLAKILEHNKRK